jgi:hypothetical protein
MRRAIKELCKVADISTLLGFRGLRKTTCTTKRKWKRPCEGPSFCSLVEAAGIEPASENATQSGLHA